ncbi:MAG: NYN domain-containing protein [Elusimicrobiota bacterium]
MNAGLVLGNYAFIDSQNLNLSIRSQGWKLDFRRYLVYLKDKYNVSKAFIFIGYLESNNDLYTALRRFGYTLIFKPALYLPNGQIKGNVDAELVLHAMIEYHNYEKAVIVTGDGDFWCLLEYLVQNNKLLKLMIPDKNKYSSLLRKFADWSVYMNSLQKKLELR